MDERIREHLQRLTRYHLLLEKAKETPLEEFLEDETLQASSERFLQLAIESCLNIGNRLISLYQFEKPVKAPETYGDIFVEMEKLGVIAGDFRERLVRMAKFRNRLVHIYWELDKSTIWEIIQNDLGDFKLFREKVVSFLKSTKEGQ